MMDILRYNPSVSIVKKEQNTELFLTSQPLDREIDEYVAVLRRCYLHHKWLWKKRKPIDSKKIELEINGLRETEAFLRKQARVALPEDEMPEGYLGARSLEKMADGVRDVANNHALLLPPDTRGDPQPYFGYMAHCLSNFFEEKGVGPNWAVVGDLLAKHFLEMKPPSSPENYERWAFGLAKRFKWLRDNDLSRYQRLFIIGL
jgi:hypothetical protein